MLLLFAFVLWQDELQQGKEALRMQDYTAARQHFARATRLKPHSAEAFFYLGMGAFKSGAPDAAERAWRSALKIDPAAGPALYNLGVLLLAERRPKEALILFEKIRRSGTVSPELAVNLTKAYLETKQNEAALRVLAEAGRQFQGEAAFHATAGKLLLDHHLPEPACRELAAANELAKAQPEIVLPMASACLEFQDALRVKAALDEVSVQPDNPDLMLRLARLYQKCGEQKKALDLLEKAAVADPSSAEVPYSMAVTYITADNEAKAIDLLERALKLNPRFARAQFFLGTIHLSALRLEQADPLLSAALAAEPRNPFYLCFLGLLRVNQLRFAEAGHILRKAEALDPAYALPHFYMGRMLKEAGDAKEAVAELAKATELNPDMAEAYYLLGTLLKRVGRQAKGDAALARFKSFRQAQEDEQRKVLRELQETLR